MNRSDERLVQGNSEYVDEGLVQGDSERYTWKTNLGLFYRES